MPASPLPPSDRWKEGGGQRAHTLAEAELLLLPPEAVRTQLINLEIINFGYSSDIQYPLLLMHQKLVTGIEIKGV